jgi:hypothetical protein
MNYERAQKLIEEKALTNFKWFAHANYEPNNVVIMKNGDEYEVYATTERGTPAGIKKFTSKEEALDNFIHRLESLNSLISSRHKKSGQSNKTSRFLNLAYRAIGKTDKEIEVCKTNNDEKYYLSQLTKIQLEVKEMISVLSPDKFLPSYPRIIIDSWSYDNRLGEELLNLFELYKKLN